MPYPIANARFSLPLSFRVAAGTPTDPTTPDTEFSTDGGATYTDCAEEITTGGGNGGGYLTLTGAETNNRMLLIAAKSANCVTTPAILHPRTLAIVGSGTLSAGSSGGGTLGTLLIYDVTGCFIRTTGGTGGGGTGGANNQARRILTYNTTTGAFTVSTWETTPDATTTYDVLLPEGVTLGMLRTIEPTLVLPTAPAANTYGEALFLADILGGRFGTAQAGSSTTITLDSGASSVDGRYVGYGVYLYGGTGGGVRGVGQDRTIVAYNGTTKVATVTQAWGTNPDSTSKFMLIVHPFVNVGIWNGTVLPASATAGIPDMNARNWGNAVVTGMPMPTYTQPTGFLAATFPTNVADETLVIAATNTILARFPANSAALAIDVSGNLTGSVGNVANDVIGNVSGKVLGGGAGVITAVGVNANVAQWAAVDVHLDSNNEPRTGTVNHVAGTVSTFDALLVTLASDHGEGNWADVTVSDKTGFKLASDGLDAVTVESGLDARQALAIIGASVAGKLSGAGTTTVTITGAGVDTVRIVATVTADENRTAVVLTPPA